MEFRNSDTAPDDPLWNALQLAYNELMRLGDFTPMAYTLAEVEYSSESDCSARTFPTMDQLREIIPDVVEYSEAADKILDVIITVAKLRGKNRENHGS